MKSWKREIILAEEEWERLRCSEGELANKNVCPNCHKKTMAIDIDNSCFSARVGRYYYMSICKFCNVNVKLWHHSSNGNFLYAEIYE